VPQDEPGGGSASTSLNSAPPTISTTSSTAVTGAAGVGTTTGSLEEGVTSAGEVTSGAPAELGDESSCGTGLEV